jgi:hypothetical protein
MEQLQPGLHIRTAQWAIGEEHPEDSGLRIDGVIRRHPPLRPLAIEFLGCYFHGISLHLFCDTIFFDTIGHRECYPQSEQRLAGGQTAATLLEKTERRRMVLERAGYEVRHIWECHFQQLLKSRPQLRAMHRELDVTEPLDLRKDAYFGGRVEPFRFNYRCRPDEEIVYIDIVSAAMANVQTFLFFSSGEPLSLGDEVWQLPFGASPGADPRAAVAEACDRAAMAKGGAAALPGFRQMSCATAPGSTARRPTPAAALQMCRPSPCVHPLPELCRAATAAPMSPR